MNSAKYVLLRCERTASPSCRTRRRNTHKQTHSRKDTMMKTRTLLLAAALLFAPAVANAEDGCCKTMGKGGDMNCMQKMADAGGSHDTHGMHDMKAAEAPKSEAAAAFAAVNAKMHKDMTMEMTGDADVDFMNGMIPHHQGAIDMANVLLKYGKDPVTQKLAEDIIKAQESEIAMMKDWLAKRQK
jgi:uncharacterized protein (DUF305 family)